MSAARTPSRAAEGEAAARDGHLPVEPGVLLASGLVCPAAGWDMAREQAERVGGVECLIVGGDR